MSTPIIVSFSAVTAVVALFTVTFRWVYQPGWRGWLFDNTWPRLPWAIYIWAMPSIAAYRRQGITAICLWEDYLRAKEKTIEGRPVVVIPTLVSVTDPGHRHANLLPTESGQSISRFVRVTERIGWVSDLYVPFSGGSHTIGFDSLVFRLNEPETAQAVEDHILSGGRRSLR